MFTNASLKESHIDIVHIDDIDDSRVSESEYHITDI